MFPQDPIIHFIPRDAEHAAAVDRLARGAPRARRHDRSGRWRRLVAWMSLPISGGAAVPVVPYPRHEAE